MATHSSILAWESHGQRSLEGYSPWGHKESDNLVTNKKPRQVYTKRVILLHMMLQIASKVSKY